MKELYSFDTMDDIGFKQWCAEFLHRMGFVVLKLIPDGDKQGVDIVAEKYGERFAVLCKSCNNSVGDSAIQQVHAGKAMRECRISVVMTNGYFSPAARELAKSTDTMLWDRDKIIKMAKQSGGKQFLEPVALPIVNAAPEAYSINNDERREAPQAAGFLSKEKTKGIAIALICIAVLIALVLTIGHGIGAPPMFYTLAFYLLSAYFLIAYIGGKYPQLKSILILVAVVILIMIIGQY